MVCKDHPKYQAKRKPRSSCETCWGIWLGLSERCFNCGCEDSYQEMLDKLADRR